MGQRDAKEHASLLSTIPTELVLLITKDIMFRDLLSLRATCKSLFNLLSIRHLNLTEFDASIIDFSIKFIKLSLQGGFRLGRFTRRVELVNISVGNGWEGRMCVRAIDDLTRPGTVIVLVRSQIAKAFETLGDAVNYLAKKWDSNCDVAETLIKEMRTEGRIEFIADGFVGILPESSDTDDPFDFAEPPHYITATWSSSKNVGPILVVGSERGDVCAAVIPYCPSIGGKSGALAASAHLASYLRMLERRWAHNLCQ